MIRLNVPQVGFAPPPRSENLIANLGNAFFSGLQQAQERNALSERAAGDRKRQEALTMLGQGIGGGSGLDYTKAAGALIASGDIGSGLGLLQLGEKVRERQATEAAVRASPLSTLGSSPVGAAPASGPAPSGDPLSRASGAIAGIESGGRYDALGPPTRTGDRAIGKYQVMGANVGPWTEKYVGRRMTPEEFAASPEAQEAVFRGEFGRLSQAYGPEGAARAWFAGERGMNDPGRRDVLGTTVEGYGQKFASAYGQQGAPTQVAQAGSGVSAQSQGSPALPPNDPAPQVSTQALIGVLSDPRLQSQHAAAKAILDNRQQWVRSNYRNPLDEESKRLEIEERKARLGQGNAPVVRTVKQPDGSEVALQWSPTQERWIPLNAPQGGNPVTSPKLTEQQSKDVGFYNRGARIVDRLEKQDQALTSWISRHGGNVPLIGNYLKSDAYRSAQQTGRDLLAVILRKDTGAAVTDSEMELYSDIFIPSPGDDAATIQQKRESRSTAIEGIRMGLGSADVIFRSREALERARNPQGQGRGVQVTTPEQAASPPPNQPQAAPQIRDGMTATNPQTGAKIRFQNGQWVPVQ